MNLLMENKIPFTYAQSPGGHVAGYWLREVEHSMSVQYAIIQRNLRKIDLTAEEPVAFPNDFKQDLFSTAAGNLQVIFVGHGTLAFAYQGKVIHVDPVGREADYGKMVVSGQELIQRMNYRVYATVPFEFQLVAVDSRGQETRTQTHRIHIVDDGFAARLERGMEYLDRCLKAAQTYRSYYRNLDNRLNIITASFPLHCAPEP